MVAVVASILIQFVSFSGPGCAYDSAQAGFFIDRWSESLNQGDFPYEKLLARDIERKAFHLPISEIPKAKSEWEMYFRFFAQHSSASADHYISEFVLTQEWAGTFKAGEVRTEILKMNPQYDPRPGRRCELTVKIFGI